MGHSGVQGTCRNLVLLILFLGCHHSVLDHLGPVSLQTVLAPNPRVPWISAAMESDPRKLQGVAGTLGEVQFEKSERIFAMMCRPPL